MDKLKHIGARIKLYRKHQNLTLEELAYLVHKSPSTLCKYENGSVNIDILTLSEIADALGVDASQLMDFKTDKSASPQPRNTTNFFRRYKRFYIYSLLPQYKELLLGVMDISASSSDSNEDSVILYLDAAKEIDISEPMYIYNGKMTCDDTFAYISLRNVSGTKDYMNILARSPQWMKNRVKSLALSVSPAYGCPSAGLMMFSTEELAIDDELLDELRVNSDLILDFADKTNIIAPL